MAEELKVRFVIDPEELKELGIDPQSVLAGGPRPSPQAKAKDAEVPDAEGGGGLSSAAMVGAMVGGLLGLMDFFKQLLASSQVLNTYAQAFGKVFSAALDMLLAPFIPVLNLMLAGMLKLTAWLIDSGYLERMSFYVDNYVVPALETIGVGLERLWSAMNETLNPLNWDWGKLGKMAAADLLINASFILAAVEGMIDLIPGIKLDAFREGGSGPLAMANAARKLVGQEAIGSEQYRQQFDRWLTSVGVGALAGQVAPVPGVGAATGAAAGGLGYGLGALYEPSDVANQNRVQSVAGRAFESGGLPGPGSTVDVTVNVYGNDDTAVQQTAEEKAQQYARDSVQQIYGQP